MPEILDACVTSILKQWKDKPSSRPAHKKDQDAQSQAFAMCTASLKKAGKLDYGDENYFLSSDEVEFANPVMTAWAFTNKPFMQGLDALSFVNEDGEPWSEGPKFLKVPLLILGAWKHAMGVLNFTKEFLQNLEKNFRDGVAGHEISADARHRDVLGALAWATGKFVTGVNKLGLKQWSVIAKPTPQGEKFVEDEVYKYASIEFHPDFKNRLAQAALSADDIVGEWDASSVPSVVSIELSGSPDNEEGNMPPEATDQTGDQGITLEQVQAQLADLQAANVTLQSAVESRDSNISRLERLALDQFVDAIVVRAKSYRDGDGRAHSAVFLEWLHHILVCEKIGEGDSIVQLEATPSSGQVHAYYRKAVAWLSQNKPGDGPTVVSANTEGTEDRPQNVHGVEGTEEIELSEDDESMIDEVWSLPPSVAEGGE